jgi:hypothetical protein
MEVECLIVKIQIKSPQMMKMKWNVRHALVVEKSVMSPARVPLYAFHCEEDHPPDRCPTSRITCFFCEGTDHVPKDCQFSFLLTKKMANQPASSNGEKHQGNTNPRQDYSFSLTPVPGQRIKMRKENAESGKISVASIVKEWVISPTSA